MKIAVFTDIYAPSSTGGIVSSIKAQKAELERLGHQVTVFCPGITTTEKDVILVPSHKVVRLNGAILARRPEVVEDFILENCPRFQDFDLIHVHYEASCSIAGVRLAKRFGIPLVQTMHGREDMAIAMNVPIGLRFVVASGLAMIHGHYLPHPVKVKRDKYMAPTWTRARMWELMVNQAECADVVVTPADHFARKLEHYGVTRPLVVVPNGIPDELVTTDFARREMADGDVLKMVWNSRVSSEKRMLPFLEALRQMKRPYVLHVFGGGNALKPAQKFVRQHKMKVKFYGTQPRTKIVKRMREAHLGVLASYDFDTQGMVLIEAEATGLPVFFCDPTLIEVVPQGGYVLAGGAEATAMALALDGIAAKQIGTMSKVMLKERKHVAQSAQLPKLLKAYALAQEKRPSEDGRERG